MSWNGGMVLDNNTIPISRWWLQSTWQGHTLIHSKSMISQCHLVFRKLSPETKASDFGEEACWLSQLTSCQTDVVSSTEIEY